MSSSATSGYLTTKNSLGYRPRNVPMLRLTNNQAPFHPSQHLRTIAWTSLFTKRQQEIKTCHGAPFGRKPDWVSNTAAGSLVHRLAITSKCYLEYMCGLLTQLFCRPWPVRLRKIRATPASQLIIRKSLISAHYWLTEDALHRISLFATRLHARKWQRWNTLLSPKKVPNLPVFFVYESRVFVPRRHPLSLSE